MVTFYICEDVSFLGGKKERGEGCGMERRGRNVKKATTQA
jgi:hypothetical protein